MKYYTDNLLRFDRNPKTINTIFKVFDSLVKMEWDTVTVYSVKENKTIHVTKNPIDIIKVDFEYSKLYDEFILWKFGHPNRILLPIWNLDADKTDLFLKCLNTSVLYYFTRKETLFSPLEMDSVMDLYLEIYKGKLPDFHLN
jgi:hypothetical protein